MVASCGVLGWFWGWVELGVAARCFGRCALIVFERILLKAIEACNFFNECCWSFILMSLDFNSYFYIYLLQIFFRRLNLLVIGIEQFLLSLVISTFINFNDFCFVLFFDVFSVCFKIAVERNKIIIIIHKQIIQNVRLLMCTLYV